MEGEYTSEKKYYRDDNKFEAFWKWEGKKRKKNNCSKDTSTHFLDLEGKTGKKEKSSQWGLIDNMQLTAFYILINTMSSFGVNLVHLGTIFDVIDGQQLYILLLLKTWDFSLFWLRNNFQTGCSCLWSLAWSHVPPLGRTPFTALLLHNLIAIER